MLVVVVVELGTIEPMVALIGWLSIVHKCWPLSAAQVGDQVP